MIKALALIVYQGTRGNIFLSPPLYINAADQHSVKHHICFYFIRLLMIKYICKVILW